MTNDLNKIALISGKLTGKKTLTSTLNEIENPDKIEAFLKEFVNLKINFDVNNEIIYINDDQDFLEHIEYIESSEYISVYPNETFTRLYITTDERRTYIIRIGKVSSAIVAKFISKESPIKFSLNSFNFIKWCVAKKIDMRNIYDIPTYVKILTNEVDPFKTISDYIEEYTDYKLVQDDNENNSMVIGNFIYKFGVFLHNNAINFDVDAVGRLINENGYFEANMEQDFDSCFITFSYKNLKNAINSVLEEKEQEFKDKIYVISPLGRIALKYGHNSKEVIEELYFEDLTITILNELYNNNIHVKLTDDNVYVVKCKYKNVASVFSLIIATLNDIFYTMFRQTFEADIRCEVKE